MPKLLLLEWNSIPMIQTGRHVIRFSLKLAVWTDAIIIYKDKTL